MEPSDASGYTRLGLKERKEEFVSNLHGSTMLEIAALSALVPVVFPTGLEFLIVKCSVLSSLLLSGSYTGVAFLAAQSFVLLRQLFDLLLSALKAKHLSNGSCQREQNGQGKDGHGYVVVMLKDFFFVGVPTIVCLTVLAGQVYIVTAFSVCLTLVGITGLWRFNWQGFMEPSSQQLDHNSNSRKTFLSSFRFTMMLVTCVSILAVDFNVFPRRYAKTETYGTGLMDLGVGSFVVANGLVSRQARDLPPLKKGGMLRSTSPLLVLGFSRLILTKGVDYQEHVAEYGVHWNFFFTLAAVAFLTSLVHVPASYCGILGVVILGVYQIVLSSGWNQYLLSPERGPSLISLNKEGIFSTLGYWSMYLISVQLGHYLFFPTERTIHKKDGISTKIGIKGRKKRAVPWLVAVDIWLLDAILWILAIFGNIYIERISRRMVIAIFLTAELVLPSEKMLLLQIFDHNLLFTFLWGNILTGLVNVTVDTISVSSVMGTLILLGYLATLIGGMAVLEFSGLHLKFW